MTRLWRTLAAAAALNMITAGAATAQTVLVRFASAGDTAEVVLNGATVASGPVGTDGVAKLTFMLPADAQSSGMDARIYVDSCDKVRRIHVVERNLLVPAAQDGCNRSEITGLYLVRRESTLVVNVSGTIPTLLMVKGDFSLKPPTPAPAAARGLVLYGGGGFASFADEIGIACGNVVECGGDDAVAVFTGGASFWITKWLALDGGYLKPSQATAKGQEADFEFDSVVDASVVTGGVRVGVPFSRLRIYASGGGNFHRATTTTVETIAGATQTMLVKTEGIGWQAGAGIEVWATKWFGLYAEASRIALKGEALDKSQGEFKDNLSVALLGVRIRLF
ncbi:MAG: hypothetical protein ABIP65_11710 [Vicinamibacterales bacterium]